MNKFPFIPSALVATGVVLATSIVPANAFSIGFENVTNNNPINVAPNFRVDVTDIGSGQVQFKFTNSGSAGLASITDIYFGKSSSFPSYLSFNKLIDGQGVEFSPGADPNTPPKGQFGWTSAFSADADSPSGFNKNGIDVSESLSFVFNLVGSTTYNQIENLYQDGTLVIALHAQSIGGAGGDSDWFGSHSSITPNDIPEPLTVLGTVAALGFGGLFQREQGKRQRKAKAKA